MLTILLSAIAVLGILRPRAGFYCLVFMLPFLPRYLGIGVGDEGFAVTPRRTITIALAIGTLFWLLANPSLIRWLRAYAQRDSWLFGIVIAIYLAKLLATINGSGLSLNLLYVVDDLALSVVPAICALVFIRTGKDEQRLALIMVFGVAITAILAVVEAMKGSTLLAGLLEVTVKEAGQSGLLDRVRDDVFRAKALFDNPLLMTEFVCIMWPWAIYFLYQGATPGRRLVALLALVGTPVTLFVAHTRSGWLVFVTGFLLYVLLFVWQRSGRAARALVAAISVALLATAMNIAMELVTDPRAYFAAGEEAGRSAGERLAQFAVVGSAWMQSPLLGFGMTRNFAEDFEFLNNLDNYWLRLLLEGGASVALLFLGLVSKTLWHGIKGQGVVPNSEFRLFMTMATVSIFSFAAYKLFLSMPTNNTYFFIFAALVLRRRFWQRVIAYNQTQLQTGPSSRTASPSH